MNSSINDSSSSYNKTNPSPGWSFVSINAILCFDLSLIFNLLLLLAFFHNHHTWIPFDLYLTNLLVSNVVFNAAVGPFEIATKLYPSLLWYLGDACCTVYMYGIWVIFLVQMTTHLLIALNRVWALWLPLSFRTHHNFKTAVTLCAATWILAHIIALPGVISDALFYRKPVEIFGCWTDVTGIPGQKAWLVLVQLVSLICLLSVLLAFPLICYKQSRRKKTGMRSLMSTLTSNPVALLQRAPSTEAHSFLLLTALTLSVLVFWTPSVIYFFLQPFTGYVNADMETVINLMCFYQPLLDPILFTLTLKTLRQNIWDMLCCKK